MSKKKKVKAPVYEEWSGNEYTDRARDDVGTYGDWVNNNWQNYLDADLDQAYARQQGIADKAYNTMWDDMLANQRRQNNQLAAANYNRFGSLGNTSSNYNQELFNRQQNDLASRLSSQEYQMLDNLVNSDYNRRTNSFNNIYNMYNNAGSLINQLDRDNWNLRNRNKEAQYVADVQNAQNKGSFGSALVNGLLGAGTGFIKGGPVGAITGGLTGGLSGALGYDYGGGLGSTIGQGMYNYSQSNPTSWLANTYTNGLFKNKNNINAIAGKLT